ncbi:MAG: NAD(P)H-hydrate dehydratase [Eubacterium sp.]|nr:NAD(P)H-hydrate dehydratase [Eubacterium sp.]
MRILNAAEIRLAEQNCFDGYATEAALMKRAGTACFEAMTAQYEMKNQRVAVLCGNGKNAGDGFVIARLLYAYGALPEIVLCDKAPSIAEPLTYFEEAQASGVPVRRFPCDLSAYPFVVDCIFGIGFHGAPRAPFDTVFAAVRQSGATVIAVDTPSGTDATTGAVCENAVKADLTVAISTLKYCHVLPPANAYCGETVTVNIGIPEVCYDDSAYAHTVEPADVKALFRQRDKNANKGTFGRQLNIAGSYQMFGAAVMATQAALRAGAGLVELALPDRAYPLAAAHLTQPVFRPVCSNEEGTFSRHAAAGLLQALSRADSVVLGCGMGVNDDTLAITEAVLKNAQCPIVLDADGINALSLRINMIEEIKVPVVLTPHPGEMARLISKQVAEIQESRIATARSFAKENGVILVLKGANTVVTDGERVFVNTSGNPGMAMGGSGDMLSGMLGAFIAQGIAPFEAAKAAVYLHGLCGDRAAKRMSQRGMLVSDMTEQLGTLMSEYD